MNKPIVITLLLATTVLGLGLSFQSNVDPARKFGWGENIGWTNWRNANGTAEGVVVSSTYLSGYVWAENAGWINMGNGGGPYANDPGDSSTFGVNLNPGTGNLSGFAWAENIGWINLGDGFPEDGVHYANIDASDFGVNIDPESSDLSGLAWGENIGWINFDTTSFGDQRARFDECDHRFFGYAWAENVGWINLHNATHFVAVGPCAAGDLNCDGEVTLDDFAGFPSSLSGPDATTACSAFDVDHDTDVDLVDYAEMQRVFMAAP